MKNIYLKIAAAILLAAMLTLCLAACKPGSDPEKGTEAVTDENGEIVTKPEGQETGTTDPTVNTVKLKFSGSSVEGAPEGSVIVDAAAHAFVIVKEGTYELTGDISNGQLQVKVADTEKVTLIFNGFTASNATSAPLYIVSGDKVTIDLADGSTNRLSDSTPYVYPDPTTDKPNACLYSAIDLKIKGNGALKVEGVYNNGIGVKKDLEIKNGTITVTGPNNIIKGGNSVTISGGNLTLSGGEDGIKSDEETKQGKGFILITEDAVVSITCSDDAIQAAQAITIDPTAKVTVNCGGDAINCPGIINVDENALITNK